MSEWDALSATDKAYAIQTQRTLDRMQAYETKLQNDAVNRANKWNKSG